MGFRIQAPQLDQMWPRANPKFKADFIALHGDMFDQWGVDGPKRGSCFMGQASTETAGADEHIVPGMRENLSYLHAERIVVVFGAPHSSAAVTMAEAVNLVRNPRALGMRVYGPSHSPHLAKMLGNIKDSDGYDFRGGGLFQTTGRDSYGRYGKLAGVDLLSNPDSIAEARTNLICALAEFSKPHTLAMADALDIRGVSIAVNGGTNALQERIDWTHRWQRVFGI